MDVHHHTVPERATRGRLNVSEEELVSWGMKFGEAARAPLLVTLTGDLGAGKTTLAKAICAGYGVAEPVTSPTYALIHRYSSDRSPVFHIDLYRMQSESELDQLGWDEIVAGEALILVEWPERAGSHLPADHVPITLDRGDDELHRVLLAG